MPLSTALDTQIKGQFEKFISGSEQLLIQMRKEDEAKRARDRERKVAHLGEYHLCTEQFYALQMNFLTLIQSLSSGNSHLDAVYKIVSELEDKESSAKKLKGLIIGLRDDYFAGMLESIIRQIEASVVSDYLGQAEYLLTEGKPGNYDHVPAAVLTGAVLEDALRRLCQRQNPPIDVYKPNGEPKTLNPLIDDL